MEFATGTVELEPLQNGILELLRSANYLQAFENTIVQGVLQTEAYARSVFEGVRGLYPVSADDIDAAIKARMVRRELIDGKRQFEIILTEHALTAPLASEDVMRGQMAHLLECLDLPGMTIGVIPRGVVLNQPWAFSITNSVRVDLDQYGGPLTVTDPAAVARFRGVFDELRGLAVYGDDVRALITGLMPA
ncbi:DUF5753 domain-containing protein [Kitasatospora phosalacinea]|uniref:DUF5753 domain-containing protein n=1 Tax=Kitasatospora phosalacinea TaxID=2065 RepID=A0A9W6PPH0_9ACTN|nr:DUF5753 domain-containing protein [Kitasatospora phosalacinea]GLW58533.1 hypothetical protein Kpho01_65440 [Kitasatospora phosalacinea]